MTKPTLNFSSGTHWWDQAKKTGFLLWLYLSDWKIYEEWGTGWEG